MLLAAAAVVVVAIAASSPSRRQSSSRHRSGPLPRRARLRRLRGAGSIPSAIY